MNCTKTLLDGCFVHELLVNTCSSPEEGGMLVPRSAIYYGWNVYRIDKSRSFVHCSNFLNQSFKRKSWSGRVIFRRGNGGCKIKPKLDITTYCRKSESYFDTPDKDPVDFRYLSAQHQQM
ncbi:unnamed protein product [Albugo candida]|uniref:Uncharacterized protein n=1 Tax=Albugo candida TaxID=65357 RepID=A0A024G2Y0_9STRA|nr:unnamed protein product [Albugo candida]|eukprot:CCI41011.1 unnamed protein product [Albugo candida]